MAELRLEQTYDDQTGAAHGSLVFRIHHLGGVSVTPERLCLGMAVGPGAAVRINGGRLRRHVGSHVEIAPPAGWNLDAGDVWQVEVHGLAEAPANRAQGVLAAWFELGGEALPIAVGDLQPPPGRDCAAPLGVPQGALTLPVCLLPWPASVALGDFGPAPMLYPSDAGLAAPLAEVAALHRRLFPAAPAPFSLDPLPGGRGIAAQRADLPAGGFRITLGPEITLAHADADGVRHGLIALAQMAHAARSDGRFRFPGSGVIEDAPRFGWRGLMLDVARNFMPAAQVMRVLDILAWHRMNRLHWHLTDDEGWRVPIDGLPQLTAVGGVRGRGQALLPQYADGPGGQAGAYDEAGIRRVVAHAGRLGIEILPEIDMPGHMTALLAALPELRDPAEPSESYRSVQGYSNNALNPGVAAVWPVLETVFDGLAALFPFGAVHVGGDEVAAGAWADAPTAQALAARERLAGGTVDLQGHFLRRVQRMLRERGRRLAGWDECAEGGGVARDALLFAWRGRDRTAALIKAGYDVVSTPGQLCYLDMMQAESWGAPGASWAGVATPEACYGFDAADGLPDGPGRLAGVQACLWTEQVDSVARFNAMAFPRLSAVAEAAWTLPARKDWARLAALSGMMPRL